MPGRFHFICFLALLQAGVSALPAAGLPEKSRASRKLLESYQQEDPAAVAKAALPLAEKGNPDAQFILGLFELIGAGVRLDHAAAAGWLNKAAAQGHPLAQLCLAWQSETGFGVPKADPATAVRWRSRVPADYRDESYARWFSPENGTWQPNLGQAFLWMLDRADSGDPSALANLADVHLANFWTNADATQHLHWLERARAAGDMTAVQRLSIYYDTGLFVPADPAKALELRRQAAAAGLRESQFILGNQLEEGRGVDRNPAEAAKWYHLAAKQDYVPALQRLILLYRNGGPSGAVDFNQAVKFAEQGRKLGDPECTRQLADLHNRGNGVPLNYKKSAELYREAADQGETNAMTMLGWIYQHGEIGSPDPVQAQAWYKKSADLGNVRAQRELGDLLSAGQGLPLDLPAAFGWYEKAARMGEAYAQEKLGLMLLSGRGVAADAEEAVNWLRLAAQNNATTSLAPGLRTWGSAADLQKGREGLIAVAREQNDPWLLYNLVAVETADAFSGSAWSPQILRVLDEPDLLNVPGLLPEACLAVLEANPDNPEMMRRAGELFQRLLAADRVQSALCLGYHALAGRFLPRDEARAMHWAKVASASHPWKGTLLLALVECTTTTDARRSTECWATIRKFAELGDPEAILAVRSRVMSEPEIYKPDPARVLAGYGPAQPAGGPSETQLQEQVRRLLQARTPGSNSPPAIIFQTPPRYPAELRKQNLSGRVVVEFVVETSGRTTRFRVVKSSDRRFEPPAVAAVQQWRFVPGWKEGQPVEVLVSQTLEFDHTK